MGGRGASGSGKRGSTSSTSKGGGRKYTSSDKTTYEGEELTGQRRYVVYSSKGFQFKNDVNIYDAKSDGNGNLTVSKARGYETNGNIPQRGDEGTYTYKTKTGFKVDGRDVKSTGIDWDNVKSISGETYNISQAARDHGMKWDGRDKKWKK